MEADERVFRPSPFKIALAVALAIVFGYGGFLTGTILLYLFVPLFLILAFKYALSSLRISGSGITTTGLSGSKTMTWSQIAYISMNTPSLELHDRAGDLTLSLDGDWGGYTEILEILFRKRPDLAGHGGENSISRFQFASHFPVGAGAVMITISSFFLLLVEGVEKIIVFTAALLCAGFVIAGWLLSPQSITLDGNRLLVRYYKREASIRAEEIQLVSLEKRLVRYGYMYFVQITLYTGKKLKLFHPDVKLMYRSIQKWHQDCILPSHSRG